MLADGLAQKDRNYPGYVYIADVKPSGGTQQFVLKMNDRGNYKIVKSITTTDKVEDPAATLKTLRNPEVAQRNIEGAVSNLRNEETQKWAGRAVVTMKFVQHAIPGGAAVDAALAGDFWEMGISLTGDAALLFSFGLSKVATSARISGRLQLAGAAIEGTVGLTRAGQGIFALSEGDNVKAAGYFGEATLRLLGASVQAISALKTAGKAAAGAEAIDVGAKTLKFSRVPATQELADEIAKKGLPRSRQTVVLIETKQGPTIVAAGGPDLTAAQKQLAREKGLLIAEDMPGFHAEITGIATAGEKGLLPTRGVATNKMCMDGPDSCYEQLKNLAERSGYELRLSSDKRSFEFVRRGGN